MHRIQPQNPPDRPCERGDINRAIKLANAEIENINSRLQALEIELQKLEQPKTDTPKPIAPKSSVPVTSKIPIPTTKTDVAKTTNAKSNPDPVPKSKPKATPTTTPKPVVKPTSKPKPRTLKQVDLELGIIETKLSGLKHASDVDMLMGYKIQDIERNLSSAGFWERRKMQKEIAEQEKKRSDFYKETAQKYGAKPQLEKEKDRLLDEKLRIENATGITAAREAEQQRKRDAVIQQRESRDRYYAERKARRLENPSKGKDELKL